MHAYTDRQVYEDHSLETEGEPLDSICYSRLFSGGTTSMSTCMKYVNLSETKEGKNSSYISMNDTYIMIIIFWEMTPCGSYKNRRFGGSYRLHLQGNETSRYRATSCDSSQHRNNWYPSTRLVFSPYPVLSADCNPHTMLYSKYRYSKHPIPLPWTIYTLHAWRSISRVAVPYKSLLFRSVPARLVTLKMEAI
jgi:hypothetical protein